MAKDNWSQKAGFFLTKLPNSEVIMIPLLISAQINSDHGQGLLEPEGRIFLSHIMIISLLISVSMAPKYFKPKHYSEQFTVFQGNCLMSIVKWANSPKLLFWNWVVRSPVLAVLYNKQMKKQRKKKEQERGSSKFQRQNDLWRRMAKKLVKNIRDKITFLEVDGKKLVENIRDKIYLLGVDGPLLYF